MVGMDEVARIAMNLPGVGVGQRYGHTTWTVGGAHFAWDRPFSKADLKRFGDRIPPAGPILATRVDDLEDKEAVLAAGHRGLFTIPHFDGYPAVLIDLAVADIPAVTDAIVDGWLACAPNRLVDDYLAGRGGRL